MVHLPEDCRSVYTRLQPTLQGDGHEYAEYAGPKGQDMGPAAAQCFNQPVAQGVGGQLYDGQQEEVDEAVAVHVVEVVGDGVVQEVIAGAAAVRRRGLFLVCTFVLPLKFIIYTHHI